MKIQMLISFTYAFSFILAYLNILSLTNLYFFNKYYSEYTLDYVLLFINLLYFFTIIIMKISEFVIFYK